MATNAVLARPVGLGLVRGVQGVAALALVFVPFEAHVPPAVEAVALVLPVVVAGALGGWLAALATGALGAFVLAVLLPPYWAPTIDSGGDRALFALYVVLGATTGLRVARVAGQRRRAALLDRTLPVAASDPLGPLAGRAPDRTSSRTARRPAGEVIMPLRPLSVFFGHHKCGSSWVADIVAGLCAELGWSNWGLDNAGPFWQVGMERWAFANRVDVVSLTNADIRWLPARPDVRAFHVIRDPRDVCVSAYFSHRNSHPTKDWPQLAEFRTRLRSADFDHGLALEIEFLRPVFEAMQSWDYARPNVLELRLEDLVAEPEQGFTDIARFLCMVGPAAEEGPQGRTPRTRVAVEKVRRRLHLPPGTTLTPDQVTAVVRANSFEVKSGGRAPGVVDADSHYRSGLSGDWRSHFTARHCAIFDAAYPDLVQKLGYDN